MKKLLTALVCLMAVAVLALNAFAVEIPETELPKLPENPPVIDPIHDPDIDDGEGDGEGTLSPNCDLEDDNGKDKINRH